MVEHIQHSISSRFALSQRAAYITGLLLLTASHCFSRSLVRYSSSRKCCQRTCPTTSLIITTMIRIRIMTMNIIIIIIIIINIIRRVAGARCSSVVRAFAHGATGRRIDPSWGVDPLSYFSFQPVFHDWCNKGRGMCYPVCGMMHIQESLLLIGKSSLCDGSGFPLSLSEWFFTIIYVRRHITVNKMC